MYTRTCRHMRKASLNPPHVEEIKRSSVTGCNVSIMIEVEVEGTKIHCARSWHTATLIVFAL